MCPGRGPSSFAGAPIDRNRHQVVPHFDWSPEILSVYTRINLQVRNANIAGTFGVEYFTPALQAGGMYTLNV